MAACAGNPKPPRHVETVIIGTGFSGLNGPNTGSGHSSQISYMQAATDCIVQAICAVKRDKRKWFRLGDYRLK